MFFHCRGLNSKVSSHNKAVWQGSKPVPSALTLWIMDTQVANAFVMTENQYNSVKLTLFLCLCLTYLLSGTKVRFLSENKCLTNEYYNYKR